LLRCVGSVPNLSFLGNKFLLLTVLYINSVKLWFNVYKSGAVEGLGRDGIVYLKNCPFVAFETIYNNV
jgi:hypothetical protein